MLVSPIAPLNIRQARGCTPPFNVKGEHFSVVVDEYSNVGGVLYVHRTHFYFLRKRYKVPTLYDGVNANLMSRRTGKRTADGNYAASRLGQPLTARWANERLRQVMLLVRALRTEWPNQ